MTGDRTKLKKKTVPMTLERLAKEIDELRARMDRVEKKLGISRRAA